MPLNKKIELIRLHFGCNVPADWAQVKPQWILALDNVGPATLDQIRLYLAGHDVALAGDKTPEHWRQSLSARIGQSMGEADTEVVLPFTVLIDSQEQQPFTFRGIRADAADWPTELRFRVENEICDAADITYRVPTEFRGLGTSMADYSIDGYEGRCHIERKSMVDAHGTILGWGERRERFERELQTLAQLDCAAVVVECELSDLIEHAPDRGRKSAAENGRILNRQVLAWQQDYRVPWIFCRDRQMAETETFLILRRFWQKNRPKTKRRKPAIEAVEPGQGEQQLLAELFS